MAISWLYHYLLIWYLIKIGYNGYIMAIMAISWLYHYLLIWYLIKISYNGYIMAKSLPIKEKRTSTVPSGVSHKKHLRILIEELRSTDSQPGESAGRVPTMRLGFNGLTIKHRLLHAFTIKRTFLKRTRNWVGKRWKVVFYRMMILMIRGTFTRNRLVGGGAILKNDGVCQLGWGLFPIYGQIWNNKTCSKPPTR